jgi:2-haloalkanoic acid dehalogenase type II
MVWPLRDYKVITMDCYGTLIDWETGIWNAYQPLLAETDSDVTRSHVLRTHAQLESTQQAATPSMLYPDVLRAVHVAFAEHMEFATSDDLDAAFGDSVQHWPAFPDATEALRRLSEHYKLVILSNVDRASFATSNARLDVTFDAIYTAEDIGSYKPTLGNFHHMLTALGEQGYSPATDILHVAQSLFHDHAPASQVGLDRVWIDRQRLSEGGDWGATAVLDKMPTVDWTFWSMADFADAVDASALNAP